MSSSSDDEEFLPAVGGPPPPSLDSTLPPLSLPSDAVVGEPNVDTTPLSPIFADKQFLLLRRSDTGPSLDDDDEILSARIISRRGTVLIGIAHLTPSTNFVLLPSHHSDPALTFSPLPSEIPIVTFGLPILRPGFVDACIQAGGISGILIEQFRALMTTTATTIMNPPSSSPTNATETAFGRMWAQPPVSFSSPDLPEFPGVEWSLVPSATTPPQPQSQPSSSSSKTPSSSSPSSSFAHTLSLEVDPSWDDDGINGDDDDNGEKSGSGVDDTDDSWHSIWGVGNWGRIGATGDRGRGSGRGGRDRDPSWQGGLPLRRPGERRRRNRRRRKKFSISKPDLRIKMRQGSFVGAHRTNTAVVRTSSSSSSSSSTSAKKNRSRRRKKEEEAEGLVEALVERPVVAPLVAPLLSRLTKQPKRSQKVLPKAFLWRKIEEVVRDERRSQITTRRERSSATRKKKKKGSRASSSDERLLLLSSSIECVRFDMQVPAGEDEKAINQRIGWLMGEEVVVEEEEEEEEEEVEKGSDSVGAADVVIEGNRVMKECYRQLPLSSRARRRDGFGLYYPLAEDDSMKIRNVYVNLYQSIGFIHSYTLPFLRRFFSPSVLTMKRYIYCGILCGELLLGLASICCCLGPHRAQEALCYCRRGCKRLVLLEQQVQEVLWNCGKLPLSKDDIGDDDELEEEEGVESEVFCDSSKLKELKDKVLELQFALGMQEVFALKLLSMPRQATELKMKINHSPAFRAIKSSSSLVQQLSRTARDFPPSSRWASRNLPVIHSVAVFDESSTCDLVWPAKLSVDRESPVGFLLCNLEWFFCGADVIVRCRHSKSEFRLFRHFVREAVNSDLVEGEMGRNMSSSALSGVRPSDDPQVVEIEEEFKVLTEEHVYQVLYGLEEFASPDNGMVLFELFVFFNCLGLLPYCYCIREKICSLPLAALAPVFQLALERFEKPSVHVVSDVKEEEFGAAADVVLESILCREIMKHLKERKEELYSPPHRGFLRWLKRRSLDELLDCDDTRRHRPTSYTFQGLWQLHLRRCPASGFYLSHQRLVDLDEDEGGGPEEEEERELHHQLLAIPCALDILVMRTSYFRSLCSFYLRGRLDRPAGIDLPELEIPEIEAFLHFVHFDSLPPNADLAVLANLFCFSGTRSEFRLQRCLLSELRRHPFDETLLRVFIAGQASQYGGVEVDSSKEDPEEDEGEDEEEAGEVDL